jgi:lipopolysaccharide export LptBFGC system permease protein LptF
MENSAGISSSKVIVKKLLISFCCAFLFVFMMLTTNQCFLIAGSIKEYQPEISQIILLFLYCIPPAVAMGVPYAVCIGFIHGLVKNNFHEKFSHNKKSVIPVLVLGLIISMLTFAFSDFVLPNAHKNFAKLFRTISAHEEVITKSPREMTSLQLIKTMNEIDENDNSLNSYIIELNKKYSIPFAALFFSFFAIAVSLLLGKHIKTAVCVSLFSCVVFWAFIMYGQNFSVRTGKYGALAMWLPNLLFLSVSTVMYFSKKHGQTSVIPAGRE